MTATKQLNTFAGLMLPGEDNAGTIFSAIRNLRNVIPNHSFIQYTATPQANLLLDIFHYCPQIGI